MIPSEDPLGFPPSFRRRLRLSLSPSLSLSVSLSLCLSVSPSLRLSLSPPLAQRSLHTNRTTHHHRIQRLREEYAQKGVRHSVDALPIVYEHGHPHVLIFQIGMSYFKLPGGAYFAG